MALINKFNTRLNSETSYGHLHDITGYHSNSITLKTTLLLASSAKKSHTSSV